MATNKDYMEFTAEQLSEAGTITYRKMFGEYGVYCDGIFFGTVEDNQLYIKITVGGKNFMPNAVIAFPHEGASFFLIENIEDKEFLKNIVRITCAELPPPKNKKICQKPKKARASMK